MPAQALEGLEDESPTGPRIHTHHEIHRLVRLYGRLVAQPSAAAVPQPDDFRDLC